MHLTCEFLLSICVLVTPAGGSVWYFAAGSALKHSAMFNEHANQATVNFRILITSCVRGCLSGSHSQLEQAMAINWHNTSVDILSLALIMCRVTWLHARLKALEPIGCLSAGLLPQQAPPANSSSWTLQRPRLPIR